MSEQTERCGNCRFFQAHPGSPTGSVGWCRYNAPSVPVKQLSPFAWTESSDRFSDYMFPPAHEEQWCGEYKVKVKETADKG